MTKKPREPAKKIRENDKIRIVTMCGIELVLLPFVFSPHHLRVSEWMSEKVSEIVRKKSLLEIGTGTGVTALACAKNGASVVAVDINSWAVKNAKMNSLLNESEIDVRKSDVYSSIKKSEKFDVIFWNHPFDDKKREKIDDLGKSIFDPEYKATEKYISGAKKYLRRGGRLLLGTGMSANFDRLREIAKKYRYEMVELSRTTIPPRNKIKVPYDIMIIEFVTPGLSE